MPATTRHPEGQLAQRQWFDEIVSEALDERGFQLKDESRLYQHAKCPGAEFDFVWIEISNGFMTGSAVWSQGDVKECVSLDRLPKLHFDRRNAIKIQIIEGLLIPCLYSCQRAIHGAPLEGLLALPPELSLRILRLLPAASLCSLAVTHPSLRALTSTPSLWKDLFARDFPLARPSPNLGGNWKELYKTEYLAGRTVLRRSPFNPFVTAFLEPVYTRHEVHNGIIHIAPYMARIR